MKTGVVALGCLTLAWLAPLVQAGDSEYLLTDPSRARHIDYLAVSGDEFAGKFDALCRHRADQGYRVGVVRMSDVAAEFGSLRKFLRHAATRWEKPAPRFLLLVGDVEAVPTVVKRGAMRGWRSSPDLATDFEYARPAGKGRWLHVGRLPCDSGRELTAMVEKTIAYETELPEGGWQRRLKFVASMGGYGKEMDRLLEAIGESVAAGAVPRTFDVEAAYGSPASPYCVYPPRFNEHVTGMFNECSLLYLFVGHGSVRRVASIRWRRHAYPIFRAGDSDRLEAQKGPPVFVAIACHTGAYDRDDCLGEEFVKAPGGPVAFIGGSRVTQPYANALFADAFVRSFFGKAKTVGEVLSLAKARIAAHRFSFFTAQIDAVAARIQGKDNLPKTRADVIRHYNLLGDPALRIRRPTCDIRVAIQEDVAEITAPDRKQVILRLECDRLQFLHELSEIEPDDADVAEKMADRYRKAHDKVIGRWTVRLKDGRGTVRFERPRRPGRYVLKATAGGSVGAIALEVTGRP
ncbi:MAG: C25 family cysteine peptidase [Planctomycetota bacterium]